MGIKDYYDSYKPNNKSVWLRFGLDEKKKYIERANFFFEQEDRIRVPKTTLSDFKKIKEDCKILLSKDCAFGLFGLVEFLKIQRRVLLKIKEKNGSEDFSYLEISTYVIKVAIFDIDQAYNLIYNWKYKHQYANPDTYYNTGLENNVWEAFKIMDKFDMRIAYREGIYKDKRKEYEWKCKINHVDTRNEKQKRKDTISSAINEADGCIFLIVLLVIAFIICTIFK